MYCKVSKTQHRLEGLVCKKWYGKGYACYFVLIHCWQATSHLCHRSSVVKPICLHLYGRYTWYYTWQIYFVHLLLCLLTDQQILLKCLLIMDKLQSDIKNFLWLWHMEFSRVLTLHRVPLCMHLKENKSASSARDSAWNIVCVSLHLVNLSAKQLTYFISTEETMQFTASYIVWSPCL